MWTRVQMAALLLGIAGCAGWAQAPATLEYSGKPLKVAFTCGPEETAELGLTCSVQEPCPVFLELSSLAALGNRILLAGNLHTANATIHSILLSSEDGGHSWTEPSPRIRYATFDQIHFIDFGTGWISGQFLFPTPHDPYLLMTADGGKTWRNHPLLDESAPGAIDQFYFSSRTEGVLVLDRRPGAEGGRYAIYESRTGGESWSLRQLSETPLTLKQPAPAPNGWRLRPDTRSKSYHIEGQVEQAWKTAASFLVHPGDCTGEAAEKPEEKPK